MKSWLTTTDHKRIGLLYFWTAFGFFLIGGLEALIIRAQLIRPDGGLGVTAETFNQLFTMHGTTMVFLALMPLSAAFFNYIIPLQIGARDVAFPRLNAFSYWVFVLGGLFLNASFIAGPLFGADRLSVAPDAGWFGYANLTSRQYRRDPTSTSGCSACRSSGSPRSPPASTSSCDSQHARAGHADAALATVYVDDARHAVPRHHRVPRDYGRARPADVRPILRHAFLSAVGRRRSDPVAALFWMSAIPRSTSSSCRRWASCRRSCRHFPRSHCSATRRLYSGRDRSRRRRCSRTWLLGKCRQDLRTMPIAAGWDVDPDAEHPEQVTATGSDRRCPDGRKKCVPKNRRTSQDERDRNHGNAVMTRNCVTSVIHVNGGSAASHARRAHVEIVTTKLNRRRARRSRGSAGRAARSRRWVPANTAAT